jgi:hypothetical protein
LSRNSRLIYFFMTTFPLLLAWDFLLVELGEDGKILGYTAIWHGRCLLFLMFMFLFFVFGFLFSN